MDRYTQIAVSCGLDAFAQAGISPESYPGHRVGVLMGTGAGGMNTIEEQIAAFREKGHRRVSPLTVPMFIPNIASAELAMKIGARGPGMGLSSACATGGHEAHPGRRRGLHGRRRSGGVPHPLFSGRIRLHAGPVHPQR
jgi:3-oxoacyl-[acyl-carrier-protein] synthase II